MAEYTELIKALRHCATRSNGCVTCAGCPMSSENGDVIECINALHKDSAAAIEALMDAEKTYLAELAQCHENLRRAAETRRERDERIEALQAEVKRLKMRCADCEYGNSPWPEELVHEPKRGKWINHKDEHQCSVCRETVVVDEVRWEQIGEYDYCPNCGVKMEVQG